MYTVVCLDTIRDWRLNTNTTLLISHSLIILLLIILIFCRNIMSVFVLCLNETSKCPFLVNIDINITMNRA